MYQNKPISFHPEIVLVQSFNTLGYDYYCGYKSCSSNWGIFRQTNTEIARGEGCFYFLKCELPNKVTFGR